MHQNMLGLYVHVRRKHMFANLTYMSKLLELGTHFSNPHTLGARGKMSLNSILDTWKGKLGN